MPKNNKSSKNKNRHKPKSAPHNKKSEYYKRQKVMCNTLGIKQPPEELSLLRKLKFIYRELTK